MGYQQVFDLIAEYCNDILPIFADRWSRWPVAQYAHACLTRLQRDSEFWDKQGKASIAHAMREAMVSIRNNM